MGEQLDGGNVATRRTRVDDRPIAGHAAHPRVGRRRALRDGAADGFEWQGRPYKSLSAVARAITGTRWNGWTFFGLKSSRGGRP